MSADDIRRDLETSRRAIQRDYAAVRFELDVVAKAKRSVVENPIPWLGGSALVGWVLSGRRRRKARKLKAGEKETVKGFTILGVLFAALRLLFPILRPTLTSFAVEKLGSFASKYRR